MRLFDWLWKSQNYWVVNLQNFLNPINFRLSKALVPYKSSMVLQIRNIADMFMNLLMNKFPYKDPMIDKLLVYIMKYSFQIISFSRIRALQKQEQLSQKLFINIVFQNFDIKEGVQHSSEQAFINQMDMRPGLFKHDLFFFQLVPWIECFYCKWSTICFTYLHFWSSYKINFY